MSLNCVESVRALTCNQHDAFCRFSSELAKVQNELKQLTQVFPSLLLAYAGGHDLPPMEQNAALETFRWGLGPSFRVAEKADELGREILRQQSALLALASLVDLHDKAGQEERV